MEELVPQCVIKPHWCELRKVMAKERTDWTAVAAHLNRIPKKCKAKWKSIQDSRKTIEHFTAEEDALIAQRVAEWGNKGRRLWSSLGREMGRDSSAIARRYRSVILVDTTVAQTVWTADLVTRAVVTRTIVCLRVTHSAYLYVFNTTGCSTDGRSRLVQRETWLGESGGVRGRRGNRTAVCDQVDCQLCPCTAECHHSRSVDAR